jgi:hypothetical protein
MRSNTELEGSDAGREPEGARRAELVIDMTIGSSRMFRKHLAWKFEQNPDFGSSTRINTPGKSACIPWCQAFAPPNPRAARERRRPTPERAGSAGRPSFLWVFASRNPLKSPMLEKQGGIR